MSTTLRNIFVVLVMLFVLAGQGLAQWQATNGPTGFAYQRVECFAQIGTNYYCGTFGDGIWRSTDNSATPWTKVSMAGMGVSVRELFANETTLFASTDNGFFKSTNNGTDWTQLSIGTSFVTCFTSIGNNLFAGGGGVYFSSDGGATWNPRNNGLFPPSVSSLAVIGTNIFAGTFGGGVFLSTNNGTDWNPVNNGLGLGNNNVAEVVSSGSNLFAVTSNFPNTQVFFSSNNGANWDSANTGFPNSTEVDLVVSGANVFASAYSDGVFLTTNNGTNWVDVNQGFGTSRTIRSLGILGEDLFAGFYDYSIYRRSLLQMITAVEDDVDIPFGFNLSQNYPNPFNPNTKISWQSPVGSHQLLKVYDVLGNEVATLVNEYRDAGTYEVNWNAVNLPSGVYFYGLQAGNFTEIKKMILIK